MNEPLRILLVDDEPLLIESLQRMFSAEGMEVDTASNVAEALDKLRRGEFDAALVDIVMPGADGLELLRGAATLLHPPEFVMLTAHATVETAVEAMKHGAYDYLQKPANVADIERVLRRAGEKHRLSMENATLRGLLSRHDPHGRIVGESEAMRELRDLIGRVGPTGSTALVLGESGVGKELVARRIHAVSGRSGAAFLTVNCGALRSSLLENELFGHVAGAFTGATSSSRGLFEQADGATLFIDEIGEMALEVQAALLQVLETGEFKRLGEAKNRRTDVRLVAATNRDLAAAVDEGTFRKDLFYRLNVFQIEVPPLREHRDDIPELCTHLLGHLEPDRSPPRELSTEALEALADHDWPGNVRELRNVLERAIILSRSTRLELDDLRGLSRGEVGASPQSPATLPAAPPADGVTLAEAERALIASALSEARGNKTEAARRLGISLRSLYTKMKRHEL